jgi:hypothetical protein
MDACVLNPESGLSVAKKLIAIFVSHLLALANESRLRNRGCELLFSFFTSYNFLRFKGTLKSNLCKKQRMFPFILATKFNKMKI